MKSHSTPGALRSAASLGLVVSSLAACSSTTPAGPADMRGPAPDLVVPATITLPSFIKDLSGPLSYDGVSDDLLTAGFGQTALPTAAPTAANPSQPTAAELRRMTIVEQYKALKDTRAAAGYGTLYGAAVAGQFSHPQNDGRVAGKEYLAYDDDGTGNKNVTVAVQIPTTFNPEKPCLLATVSSGSRGVYGAIGTGGEWGLKNGCAVVHTDKGTGSGVHDLGTDTVNAINGLRGAAATLLTGANFRAQGTGTTSLSEFQLDFPLRIAQKHAHSMQNPEADWGTDVLHAIQFAFYVLNRPENYGHALPSGAGTVPTIFKQNTLVIAASVSNGGGAVLRAAEQDSGGLIDGVVASEPNVNPTRLPQGQQFTIQQWDQSFPASVHGKPLYDYITYYNLFQPCASAGTMIAVGSDPALGPPAQNGFLAGTPGRCTSLQKAGLLKSATLTAQIAEAQTLLNQYGTLAGSDIIAHPYNAFYVYSSIAVTYANAYGRFSVVDNLCGYSYAALDASGNLTAKPVATLASDFALSNGIPPSNGTSLINNSGNAGKGGDYRATTTDEYLTGALCLRSLFTGTTGIMPNSGTPLTGTDLQNSQRVQAGIAQILAGGDLRGKPALIVHGRDDALLHPNFTSRSYYGLNQTVEGQNSKLSYVEVTNANHLDAFNAAFNKNTQIPLDYYLQRGLDRMYAYLRNGTALPKSQVIPTTTLATSGGTALSAANLPDFDTASTCAISFSQATLNIPKCGN